MIPSFINQLADKVNSSVDELMNNHDFMQTAIRRVSQDLSSYENQEIAGKCLLWSVGRTCNSFSGYLCVYKDRFNDRVRDFLIENESDLTVFLNENEQLSYHNKDYFSASTIINNYLLRASNDEAPLETPLFMFLRVASQLHAPNVQRVKDVTIELATGYYIPSSPTLFNSGVKKCQLASCFLLPIQDRLDDILYTGVGDAGIISSHGGGLGMGMSGIRHSQIGDFGMSNGVVPVGRVYDKLIEYANQSGKRKGAGTAFLAIWHLDIMEFVESTNNFNIAADERFSSLNTCVWTNDLFFQRVKSGGTWTLFCPAKANTLLGLYNIDFEIEYMMLEAEALESENNIKRLKIEVENARNDMYNDTNSNDKKAAYVSLCTSLTKAKRNHLDFKVLNAKDIFEKIIDLQIKSGMPYICHGDSVNWKSNHKNIAPINSSNLCLEIMEAAPDGKIASCNLASMNLSIYADQKTKTFDYKMLSYMTRSCVKNLNAVIDHNYYPLDERDSNGNITKEGKISSLNRQSRPIGLGCSGFSDAMAQLDIIPESDEEIKENKKIFACMYYNALLESINMAIESGSYYYINKGTHETYSQTMENGDVHVSELEGSPFMHGRLQFDLWQEHAKIKLDNDTLNEKIYDTNDDIPLNPIEWGQEEFTLCNGNTVSVGWEHVKNAMIKYGIRNSLLLALMPTASSAQAIRNAETTEYHQTNIYSRSVQSGHFTVMNRWMVRELEELKLWDETVANFIVLSGGSLKYLYEYFEDHSEKYPTFANNKNTVNHLINKYKTQFEISQKHLIKMSRQRGIYVDQSQSFNLFMKNPTINKLKAAHMYSNEIGNKVGMYYLRAEPPSSSDGFGIDMNVKNYYLELMKRKGIDTSMSGSNTTRKEVICESCA